MNGIQLLHHIRAKKSINIRFVLMSGLEKLPDGRRLEDVCASLDAKFIDKGHMPAVRELIPQLLAS